MGGFGSGRCRDWTRVRRAIQLREAGLTYAEIGEQVGLTRQGVHKLLKVARGKVPPTICCMDCGTIVEPVIVLSPRATELYCPACLLKHPEATFGQRLRAFRLAKGLTREELGKRSGMTGSMMGKIEQGQKRPTALAMWAIARGLGVSVEALVCEA